MTAVCPRPEKERYLSKKIAKRALRRHRGGSLYRKLKRQGLL